jgi:hypothetical protein
MRSLPMTENRSYFKQASVCACRRAAHGPWYTPQRRKKPLSIEDARSRPHTSRQMAEDGGRWAGGRKQRTEGKERKALRREPRGVKLAVMKRTDSSWWSKPLADHPKREDRQSCLITCWPTMPKRTYSIYTKL